MAEIEKKSTAPERTDSSKNGSGILSAGAV